ncbi:hypothetical protein ACFV1N_45645 [Streptosporangium canum]|uniref:hypothetical protein n=1 Tax=Streptosporangium canum TaxID=324952 RepID=UPI0036B1CF4C
MLAADATPPYSVTVTVAATAAAAAAAAAATKAAVSLVQIFRLRDGKIALLRDYFAPEHGG